MDPQENVGARHAVLARLVENVCAGGKRGIVPANSCSWGSLLKTPALPPYVLGLVNESPSDIPQVISLVLQSCILAGLFVML